MDKNKKTRGVDLSNEDDAYGAIFGGDLGSLEIGSYIGQAEEGITQHSPNAIDFEDEDELADEELPDEESLNGFRESDLMTEEHIIVGTMEQQQLGSNSMKLIKSGKTYMAQDVSADDFDGGNNALFMGMENMERNVSYGGYMPEEPVLPPEELMRIETERRAKEERLLLRSYFPEFKKGKILKWNRLLHRRLGKYPWQRDFTKRSLKPLIPLSLKFHVQQDQRRLFNTTENVWQTSTMGGPKRTKHGIFVTAVREINPEQIEKGEKEENEQKIPEDLVVATDNWDQERIIGEKSHNGAPPGLHFDNPLVDDFKDWNWDENDLVEANLENNAQMAELDMNDERLLLVRETAKRAEKLFNPVPMPYNEKTLLQKFNISNDDDYRILRRNHQTRIRATISNLNIEHSQPAIRLQSPYYKVTLPKDTLRHLHKPDFGTHIRPGTNIVFSKLKTRKKKRDKGKEVKESFASTQDLTLGDTAPVFLMEYSEEAPIALSKFGMANKLINYYRKMNEHDTSRPKLPVGETHVLGVQDKSPFWNFGFVEPGHIVPTLYNNMIRAPVFKHDVSGTDFLLVRSSGNGISNRFYLRTINHLFTVGQAFPCEEIPGPNSRRVTSMRTTRLRMVVYRILNRTPSRAISIEPIARHFPDQDYGQNRQKIKEFMKYQREGPDKGLWKLKDGEPLLDNESAKKLIYPEQVSEVESMSQGLQFQEDTEFYNFDEKLAKLEENLLPWNATKNFVNATQMRAMIQIHGAGDPTGCGEGFSFLKTSMKGGFVKSGMENGKPQAPGGHSYNVAQQQKAYDEEISKTWYTHTKSLNVTNPFEEMENPDEINQTNRHVRTRRDDGKVLRIVRKKRDENGIIQRQTAIIRDPRIIKGYLKSKEKRREANLDVDKLLDDETTINNAEDIEMQKKLLQNELASLEKSQQRRAARQVSKTKTQDGKVAKGKNTTRRCATCGQIGHIRTNKSCPMYNGSNGGGQLQSSAGAAGSLSAAGSSNETPPMPES
ncbi:TAF1 (YGR274C) [Zygosaccharomyces parabailii]|nr:TAF1 (YGR274C) [Zygosaccharomyces parabailii]CDH10731.1 related to Transcription initiation factor TFIID subunit 1 [Zygosaccharomyces bailii ISA1307]